MMATHALAGARRSRILLDALPEDARPVCVETALAVQRARGAYAVGGWKCALPSNGKLILAPIDAGTIVDAPGPIRVTTPDIRYEPELAFTLASDLPARNGGHDRASVLAAVGTTRLALEIVHGRFREPDMVGFLDMLADDLFNEGAVLGPTVDPATPMAIVIDEDGARRTIAAAHPAGDPLAPLVWLADHLAAEGRPLAAGMTVITGSFTPAQVVRSSVAVGVGFAGLGEIAVRFIFDRDFR